MARVKPPSKPGTQTEPVGVYVHFPWCLTKCPYCDFLSVATEPAQIPHQAYTEAVVAELGRRLTEETRVASVFFGGGTPSLWEPRALGRVLARLREHFVDQGVEVTVECNPTSFDAARAAALLDVGVNRVSLGVQSLSDEQLAFLGRLHQSSGALRAVREAVASGMPRVSADLIFGVAGQSAERAVQEALAVVELGVTHLSAYALTIESGTRFGALAKRGRLPLLSDDIVADSFTALHEALTAAGFEHYEISNYARPAQRSEHNVGYWRGRDYLGLGCGAWGTVTRAGQRVRYRNTPSPERYLAGDWSAASLAEVGPLVSEVELIDPETALRERLMLGLRMAEGVDVEAAAAELGAEPWPAARRRALERLLARGRIARKDGRLLIPPSQWLLADGSIAELI